MESEGLDAFEVRFFVLKRQNIANSLKIFYSEIFIVKIRKSLIKIAQESKKNFPSSIKSKIL